MGPGPWIGVIAAGIVLNAAALVLGGEAYTAWSIRTRNQMYHALLGREVNRQRAEDAEEIAEGVVRWLRPLLLVAANAMVVLLILKTLRGS